MEVLLGVLDFFRETEPMGDYTYIYITYINYIIKNWFTQL